MMCCPFCRQAAHVRTSRYMSENVKERYHQCQNLECSATSVSVKIVGTPG